MSAPKKSSASRERKTAAKNLGLTFQALQRRLLEAEVGHEETLVAIELGQVFNTNMDFVIWVLKEYGGVQQMPFERRHADKKLALTLVPPEAVNEENKLPVLDGGIFGADPVKAECICGDPVEVITSGHMSSCPMYNPPAPTTLIGLTKG